MASTKTIPRSGTLEACGNYANLLREGIDHCQKLGGDLWTDYNQHDPGVTILQQLCFALTDLAYRTDFNVADLLAVGPGQQPPDQPLYTGDRILTCWPVTVNDYRKLLYDRIDGVKNAWLVPCHDHPLGVQGLYEVLVETREDIPPSDTPRIMREVQECMRTTRNLAEDVDKIRLLQPQPIRVETTIEIEPQANPSLVLAQALFEIQCNLIPYPRVQIIDELLRRQTPDTIWNGPLLEVGALEPESLKDLPTSIEVDEIAHILLRVKGVKRVQKPRAGTVDHAGNYVDPEELKRGSIRIQEGCIPQLYPPILEPQPSYSINVNLEGGFKTRVDARAVWLKILQLDAERRNGIAYAFRSSRISAYRTVPVGEFRNLERYASIQQQFPAAYGLGKYGASNNLMQGFGQMTKPEERQARVRQLRAYLLFFEQQLADYLAQLAHVGDLLSLDPKLDHSYFHQSLIHNPPLSTDPQNVIDVLLQNPATPQAKTDYGIDVVDEHGDVIFSVRSLSSLSAAEQLRIQILESGQDPANYRTHTIGLNRVKLALHNAKGDLLALGDKRYSSVPSARADAEHLIRMMSGQLGGKPLAAASVKILSRQDHGLSIIDEHSRAVLSAHRIYSVEEREHRIREILAHGIDRRNYRIRPAANGTFRVDLHGVRDESLAQGKIAIPTELEAEEHRDALIKLVRRMAANESVRDRHLRQPEETDSRLQSFEAGVARLWRKEDRDFLSRRNKLLDHLLARFAEHFDDDILERLDTRPFGEKDGFFRELIRWKIEFLRDYVSPEGEVQASDQLQESAPIVHDPSLGGGRGLGADYGSPATAPAASGLERRVSLLLGLHGHDKDGQYSAEQTNQDNPGFSYLEKYVWLHPEKIRDATDVKGDPLTLSRYRIAGPWPPGEPNLNDLHRNIIFSYDDSSILRQLLTSGLDPNNYRVLAEGNEHRILFHPPESAEAIEIHRVHTRDEADKSMAALIAYLRGFAANTARSYAGERMHVLEHVLLRPWQNPEHCAVHISDSKSDIHLRSAPVKRSHKDETLRLMLQHGQHPKNYQTRPHESGKYVLVLVGEERELAQSSTMFATEAEAATSIQVFVELVVLVDRHPHARRKHLRPLGEDFYSHRVSVVFPNWPIRFQNNEFRLYAEQLVYENAPAHVRIDCYWLNISEMAEFEKLYDTWKSLRRSVQLQDESSTQTLPAEDTGELDQAAGRLKSMLEAFEERQRMSSPPVAGPTHREDEP